MTLNLYNCTGEEIRINKTSYIGTATVVSGDQVGTGQNVLEPSFYVESATVPTYNYAYIADYGRYYFVRPPVWIGNNIWRLDMHVDPLYTYKTEIGSQSGIIQYSDQGSAMKYDPRLVYNVPPDVTRAVTSSTLKDGTPAYILMRCKRHPVRTGSLEASELSNNVTYYIFTPAAYELFVERFWETMRDHEGVGVECGKAIIDVSIVYWLNVSGFPSETTVNFNTPGVLQAIKADQGLTPTLNGYNISLTVGGDSYPVYVVDHLQEQDGYFVSFFIEPTTYWQRKASRTVYIPYVGTASLDQDLLGQGYNTALYIGFQIKYDFAGNAYVLTPAVGALTSDPDALPTIYPDQNVRVSNQYQSPYFMDSSNSLADQQMQSQILGLIGQGAAAIASGIMTEGASVPASLASLGMGVANMSLTQQRIQAQKAGSLVSGGSSNGGSPDNVYLYIDNNNTRVYPQATLVTTMSEPATGWSDFQAAFGKPDGAYRALSGLSGYYQIADIYLVSMGAATQAERNEILQYLHTGVIA